MDNYETPKRLFEVASRAFGPFVLDAAASWENSLCQENFLTDALTDNPWPNTGPVWLNPPFSRKAGPLLRWMQKAEAESKRGEGRRIVVLVKADTSTEWFDFAFSHAKRTMFLQPRVRFCLNGEPQPTPPWGCVLFVFQPGERFFPRIVRWK